MGLKAEQGEEGSEQSSRRDQGVMLGDLRGRGEPARCEGLRCSVVPLSALGKEGIDVQVVLWAGEWWEAGSPGCREQ